MRRIFRLTIFLLMLTIPALADETWTAEEWGDAYVYTQTDTEWGHITYRIDDWGYTWMANFRYGDCVFGPYDDYTSVHDEMTQLQTFYRDKWWNSDSTPEEIAVHAEELLQNGEAAFIYDLNQAKVILPDVGEIDMHDAPLCEEIVDAYIRGKRLFMTIDTADDRHFLYIITWQDGLDVRTIEIPWSGAFDTFHVGADTDDFFILYLDANEDFGYITAGEVDGRWLLGVINTGWDAIDVADWGVRSDVNEHWVYGECPWRDLETMDWTTLPLTYGQAAERMNHQGWMFPKEETTLLAAPDTNESVLMTIPADTPVCLLRTDGDWAFVGVQAGAGCICTDKDWWGPWVGYVSLAALNDTPQNVLPGGEIYGWFVTMTVEEVPYTTYLGKVRVQYYLNFAPLDGYYESKMPIKVTEDFAEKALAVYREKGYAATPLGFDEGLLPLLENAYAFDMRGVDNIRDAIVVEDKLMLAMEDNEGNWYLRIETEALDTTDIQMPGAFCFSRDGLADAWNYAVKFTE